MPLFQRMKHWMYEAASQIYEMLNAAKWPSHQKSEYPPVIYQILVNPVSVVLPAVGSRAHVAPSYGYYFNSQHLYNQFPKLPLPEYLLWLLFFWLGHNMQ